MRLWFARDIWRYQNVFWLIDWFVIKYFCPRTAAVVSRKVAKGLCFDCGQRGSFTVFAVYLRFPAVAGRTAEDSGSNSTSVKGVYILKSERKAAGTRKGERRPQNPVAVEHRSLATFAPRIQSIHRSFTVHSTPNQIQIRYACSGPSETFALRHVDGGA